MKTQNYFRDGDIPTINELVYWFQCEFTDLANDMKGSQHCVASNEPNPYHIEDHVWTHTMMVCMQAESGFGDKINLIAALLHDIGKPLSREVIPFEAKKPIHTESNEIRNKGKNDGKPSGLQKVVPKSGLKTHFRGHEGLSFYKSIDPLKQLLEFGVINQTEMNNILTIISMHGTLFDNISADGEMIKPHKVFGKFEKSGDGLQLFNQFVLQVRNDSLGRFFVSKDGRKSNAYRLGSQIFTSGDFSVYCLEAGYPNIKNSEKTANITVLVGPPGCGKSTWLDSQVYEKGQKPVLVSRDSELMSYAQYNDIEGNYSQVWGQLTQEDQKEIDTNLQNVYNTAKKENKDIVVDMTNMSRKSRRKWLSNVPKTYSKSAIVFATSFKEVFKRLDKREKETGKAIPLEVAITMMKGFMVPTFDEVDFVNFVY